jgi:hypothetical protein
MIAACDLVTQLLESSFPSSSPVAAAQAKNVVVKFLFEPVVLPALPETNFRDLLSIPGVT